LLIAPIASAAEGPFLRLERVDASSCRSEGVVSAAVAELALDGSLRSFGPSGYRLMLDGATLSSPPRASRRFKESETPLSLAVVVEANLAYRADLALIARELQDLLRALPKRTEVSVLSYGDGVRRLITRAPPEQAAASLEGLVGSDEAGGPAVDALRSALLDLDSVPRVHRRLLAVISDGLDEQSDRDAWRDLGNLARARAVPIHPIAYSAIDERGPLLNLGEIVKRTNGTFRWARTPADIGEQLDNLAAEIGEQLILDFDIPDRCERSHTAAIAHGTLRSNARDIPAAETAATSKKKVYALAIAGAALLAAALVLFRLRRR